jgi:Flp pilus assembly protein TadD
MLNENKEFKEAITVLNKGIIIDPSASELYYALTFVYIQSNNVDKARQSALKLKQLDPNNPNYSQLFSSLKI